MQPRMLTEQEVDRLKDFLLNVEDIPDLILTCQILRVQLASEREHAHRLTQALHEMQGRL